MLTRLHVHVGEYVSYTHTLMDIFSQLSIMIIYNSTWSIRVILSGILKNTKESILLVCGKPYHTNKGIKQVWEELEKLRNYALQCYIR